MVLTKICGLHENLIEIIGDETAGQYLKTLYAFNSIRSKKKEKIRRGTIRKVLNLGFTAAVFEQ